MKKSRDVALLVLSGLFYMVIASGMSVSMNEIVYLAEILLDIVRVVLSVYCIIMTANTAHMRENNRANFLAVSSFIISLFIITRIVIKFACGGEATSEMSEWLLMCSYAVVYGLLFSLGSALLIVNEKNHYTKAVGMTIAIIFVFYFVMSRYMNVVNGSTSYLTEDINCKIKVIAFYCTLIMLGVCIKTIHELKSYEKRIFISLFVIRVTVALVGALGAKNKDIYVHLIGQFVECVYLMIIVCYINEVTFKLAWKKIDLSVKSKETDIIAGKVDEGVLVIAAKAIEKDIGSITQDVLQMEKVINEQYGGKDLSYLNKIKNNCARLFKLNHSISIMNTLDSRADHVHFQTINVAAFVSEVITSIEPYINEKGMHLDYSASNEMIMGEVDQEGLERIIINLISNAVKYNRTHGSIIVRLTQKKDRIYLSVRDTGVGIPEQSLETAFNRFHRVKETNKNNQEGSGLGLAIVRSLVAVHYGEIAVASKIGKGTVISINLPVRQKKDVPIKTALECTEKTI